jgi:hypothetical protein
MKLNIDIKAEEYATLYNCKENVEGSVKIKLGEPVSIMGCYFANQRYILIEFENLYF